MSDVKEHAEESNGLNNGSPATKRLKKDVDNNGEASVEFDFDSNTQKILEEIDLCQNEIDSLNEKASEEILKVEQKFNKLRKPFFEKRNELIKTIPSFWNQAFINHGQIRNLISTEEEGCIQHLKNIEIEEFEDIKSGYRIKFHFDENPFFENKILVKEFHLGGEPTCTSTEINWKQTPEGGKHLHDVITSKQRKSKVSITFFLWFLENGDASSDDVAEIIKDDLWPNPLQYFLNSEIDQNTADESDDNIVELEDEDDEENDNDCEEGDEEDDEEGDDEECDE